jgi:hypothetical protein
VTLMFVIKKNQWISQLKEKCNNLNIYINLKKLMVYLQTTYELRTNQDQRGKEKGLFLILLFFYWPEAIHMTFHFLTYWLAKSNFFPRKYKYICIRVYGWFKDVKYVIWMWIWLILNNISLLDRIWWLRLILYLRYCSICLHVLDDLSCLTFSLWSVKVHLKPRLQCWTPCLWLI